MTDQTIPADKVREIVDGMRESMRRAEGDRTNPKFMGSMSVYVAALEALLPPPPRPTLADMTEEECAACQWMQADTEQWGRVVLILPNLSDGRAALLDRRGKVPFEDHAAVTPRPDLPRMTWPDTADAVPESTLAVGSEWHDADALAQACEETGRDQITVTDRDGDVSVWDGRRDDWRSRWPIPKSAPFTIIHAGKKDDQ